MIVWPWRLLVAGSYKTRLSAQVQSGAPSLSGLTQTSRTDGGGYWMSDLTKIVLRTPDQVRTCRAWSAMLDGGASEFVLPMWDLAQAPMPTIGGLPAVPLAAPRGTGDYFAQDPSFGQRLISAAAVGAQALRSTTLAIRIGRGSPIMGGEHFSIDHPSAGWRLYRVGQITAVGAGASAGVQTCSIRPPLREAVADGTSLEFDVPRYQAKLAPGMEPDLEQGRWATVALYAVESFSSGDFTLGTSVLGTGTLA